MAYIPVLNRSASTPWRPLIVASGEGRPVAISLNADDRRGTAILPIAKICVGHVRKGFRAELGRGLDLRGTGGICGGCPIPSYCGSVRTCAWPTRPPSPPRWRRGRLSRSIFWMMQRPRHGRWEARNAGGCIIVWRALRMTWKNADRGWSCVRAEVRTSWNGWRGKPGPAGFMPCRIWNHGGEMPKGPSLANSIWCFMTGVCSCRRIAWRPGVARPIASIRPFSAPWWSICPLPARHRRLHGSTVQQNGRSAKRFPNGSCCPSILTGRQDSALNGRPVKRARSIGWMTLWMKSATMTGHETCRPARAHHGCRPIFTLAKCRLPGHGIRSAARAAMQRHSSRSWSGAIMPMCRYGRCRNMGRKMRGSTSIACLGVTCVRRERTSPPGNRDWRDIPSSMRACASCGQPDGCTIACGWSLPASWSSICWSTGVMARAGSGIRWSTRT